MNKNIYKKLSKDLKENGYIFVPINKLNKIFILKINTIIQKYLTKKKINLLKLNEKIFSQHIFRLQNEINKQIDIEEFFKNNKNIFEKILKSKKISTQYYFYLRCFKPNKNSKNYKPISLHRETFQGPEFFKHIYNLWIPILNCSKSNALKFVENSHNFKSGKDFEIAIRSTNIKKKSFAHKTGLLYQDRKLNFNKEVNYKMLFKKNNFVIFSGQLIHGNAKNYFNKIRFSIDLRFMKKKNMKFNPVQGSSGKKYFKLLKI